MNDLPNNLSANVKLFADNTSLFSAVHNITTFSDNLNYDLDRVREWAFQCNMSLIEQIVKIEQEMHKMLLISIWSTSSLNIHIFHQPSLNGTN